MRGSIDGQSWLVKENHRCRPFPPSEDFLSNKQPAPSNCFCMSCLHHLSRLAPVIPVVAFVFGMTGPMAPAEETGAKSRFEEHHVEFHNQDVKLAGSLLLPKSDVPVPAVVFVY